MAACSSAGAGENRIPNAYRGIVRDAHSDEYDRKGAGVPVAQPRIEGDLRGQAIVRQPRSGEQGQLLAAHQAVHEVDARHAGLDEIARQRARRRVDGQPVDAHALDRGDRSAAVGWTAYAVESVTSIPGPTADISQEKKPTTPPLTSFMVPSG